MYKVIMVPTNGDELERGALSVAIRFAMQVGAELRLIEVETEAVILAAGTTGFTETADFAEAERASKKARLDAVAAECRDWGVQAVGVIVEGPPGPTLVEYAGRENVDMIVMASHGRGGLKRVSLGSVTDFVIRSTHIPVLVVKPHATFLTNVPGEKAPRILVPLDGSALSEEVLSHVESLARSLSATVSLVQVMTPFADVRRESVDPAMPWWETQVTSGETYLSRVERYLTEKGLTVSHEVIRGEKASDAIIRYAVKEEVGLIALSTSGVGGLSRLVLGTVADEISRKSPISVLVFHPGFVATEVHDRITPRETVG